MALIANQARCSYATFSPRLVSKNKPVKLEAFAPYQLIRRTHRSISFNQCFPLSNQRRYVVSLRRRPCKISSFKGNAQNDESEKGVSNSKFPKSSIQISFAEDREDIIADPSDAHKHHLTYVSDETEQMTAGSPVIQLFKKWLVMLSTQTANQQSEDIFKEGLPQPELSHHKHDASQQGAAGQLITASWGYFLGLDAAIKVPPIVFVPLYLIVNIVYGAEVLKELKPLWIFGPLFLALYIKILKGIWGLYVFGFKLAVKLGKNLPFYCLLTYNYVAEGRLKEFLARLWQPVVDIRNQDYKEPSEKKMVEFVEWAEEKKLDYIESIWPYYCRTIRFLKKANLL